MAEMTFTTFARRAALALALAAGGLANAATAAAQTDADQPRSVIRSDEPAQDPELAPDQLNALSADLTVRLLFERLRQLPNPSPLDYEITARGMRLIQAIMPDDAELVRYEIDAWNAAGDREQALDATRRLVRLDSADTVAQLRLVTAAIEGMQTADERLRAYQRLVNADDGRVSASIRSRAALDGALLAREMGDDDLFVELLTAATVLDRTNKSAAALFATYFLDRVDTPLERVEVLANVVLADPLDPEAYANLSREFLRHGAYQAAQRFLQRRLDVFRAYGQGPTLSDFLDLFHCQWRLDGAHAVLERIARLQQSGDQLYQLERQNLIAQDIDPGPEIAQLIAPRIELARLIVLVAMGDDARGRAFRKQDPALALEEQVAEARLRAGRATTRFRAELDALQEGDDLPESRPPTPDEAEELVRRNFTPPPTPDNLRFNDPVLAPAARDAGKDDPPFATVRAYHRTLASIAQTIDELQAPPQDGQTAADPQALAAAVRALRLERVWTRLFMAVDVQQAAAELDLLVQEAADAGEPLANDALNRFRGWIAALRGDAQQARQLLEPLAQNDPSARWALAANAEWAGDRREAARHLLLLIRDHPEALLSAAAAERTSRLLSVEIAPPQLAQKLNRYSAEFAPWIDALTAEPRSFVNLTVSLDTTEADPLSHPRVTVTLRNSAPTPLSIGGRQTVSSRILLTPQIAVGPRRIPQDLFDDFARAARQQFNVPEQQAQQIALQQVRQLSQRLLEVIELDRRLRLEPREAVTARFWPSRGFAGAWIDQDATRRAFVRWRATQGFVATQSGYAEGPLSLSAETRLMTRQSLPAVSQDQPLRFDGHSRSRMLNVVRAVSMINRLRPGVAMGDEPSARLVQSIRDQLTQAAPSFTPAEAEFTLTRLLEAAPFDPDQQDDPLRQAVVASLGERPSPIASLKLLLFVPQAHSPEFFDQLERSNNADVRAVAAIVRRAVERNNSPDPANNEPASPNSPAEPGK